MISKRTSERLAYLVRTAAHGNLDGDRYVVAWALDQAAHEIKNAHRMRRAFLQTTAGMLMGFGAFCVWAVWL